MPEPEVGQRIPGNAPEDERNRGRQDDHPEVIHRFPPIPPGIPRLSPRQRDVILSTAWDFHDGRNIRNVFDTLTERLGGIFDRMRGKGRLSEADVDASLREIRLALLEADVNVAVARDLLKRVKERAVGTEVTKSLTPGQQVVKIVNEELVTTLGTEPARLSIASQPPTVILMVGLQGSGKTTSAAKLSRHLVRQGKQPMLVAADLQRPAAIEQLQTLGERIGVPVFTDRTQRPARLVKAALKEANRLGRDVVVVDTAGRLQIDRELMGELADLNKASNPTETLLVVDAMTGRTRSMWPRDSSNT